MHLYASGALKKALFAPAVPQGLFGSPAVRAAGGGAAGAARGVHIAFLCDSNCL